VELIKEKVLTKSVAEKRMVAFASETHWMTKPASETPLSFQFTLLISCLARAQRRCYNLTNPLTMKISDLAVSRLEKAGEERCQSGRLGTTGNRVYRKVPRVRIPPSPSLERGGK
jgi:hypothetical protein